MNQNYIKSVLAVMIFAGVGVSLIQLWAQTPNQPGQGSRSVWDGVYSQPQADRGKALYSHGCASCHGDNLMGKESENSPALTGERFTSQWDGRTVGDMYRKILRKMPQDDPGTLSPQQTVDLVAFLLSFNKFPAGKSELPPQNDVLAGIHFDQKKIEQK
jgi:S-disulfanyl-L-cysteine oxidoreductase SoxD